MTQQNQLNRIVTNINSQPFQDDIGGFRRTPDGSFVKKPDKKGHIQLIKIASHGVSVSKIVFVLFPRRVEVRYILRFHTGKGPVEVAMRHTDLNEEKAFLNVAPPGFSLASAHQSYHKFREMLMLDLSKVPHMAVLTSLGWYVWKKKPVFAHAGGVICSELDVSGTCEDRFFGTSQTYDLIDIDAVCSDVPILIDHKVTIEEIDVEFPEQFSKYRFEQPESVEELRGAVRESFEMLTLGHADVTYLTIAALFFAALRNPRFAIFLYGRTGSLKTAFAILLLSFFVDNPQESDLASFKSTENALRARFSASGNVPVVVDDFIERPGARRSSMPAEKADNVIRSIVNGNGKERAERDGSLSPNDRPRGLPIVTGETFPSSLESLKHRTINIEIDPTCFREAVQGSRVNRFSHFQKMAADGVFKKAMAAFIAWSTKRFDSLQEYLDRPIEGLHTDDQAHPRLPDAANDLVSGMGAFLCFAQEVKAISDEEFEEHAVACFGAIEELLQRAHLESLEDCPTEVFGQLLQSALAAGKCHIEVNDHEDLSIGDFEIPMDLLGHTKHEYAISRQSDLDDMDQEFNPGEESGASEETEIRIVFRPHGVRIGWINNGLIDLIPDAALAIVNSLAARSGAEQLPNKKTLGKMLSSKDWIAAKSKDRNTYKVRHGDVVKDVWRIHALRLFEPILPWGDFDVESYKEMSLVERRQEFGKVRRERLHAFRQKLARYQADALLNPHLAKKDRSMPFPADPPIGDDFENVNGIDQRYKPFPPETRSRPGYDDPEGDGLLA